MLKVKKVFTRKYVHSTPSCGLSWGIQSSINLGSLGVTPPVNYTIGTVFVDYNFYYLNSNNTTSHFTDTMLRLGKSIRPIMSIDKFEI